MSALSVWKKLMDAQDVFNIPCCQCNFFFLSFFFAGRDIEEYLPFGTMIFKIFTDTGVQEVLSLPQFTICFPQNLMFYYNILSCFCLGFFVTFSC